MQQDSSSVVAMATNTRHNALCKGLGLTLNLFKNLRLRIAIVRSAWRQPNISKHTQHTVTRPVCISCYFMCDLSYFHVVLCHSSCEILLTSLGVRRSTSKISSPSIFDSRSSRRPYVQDVSRTCVFRRHDVELLFGG